ncbi:MAG: PHP domain-containing protein [Clostridia bacterium]|nr:PHP domain-containing protein [Clostridia bacterium]
MLIHADFHTHTRYSHGKGTPEDNVRAAIDRGLTHIAISDHGPASLFWGIRGSALTRLRREVDALNDRYGDRIRVLMGVECNLTGDGKCDLPKDERRRLFDVVILGYHRGIWPRNSTMCRFLTSGGKEHEELAKRSTDYLLHTIEEYPIDFISHPGEYLAIDLPRLAKGAAECGVALEINGKHPTLTPERLRIAAQQGARFVISSDAHHPDKVGVFGDAPRFAQKAGVEDLILNQRKSNTEGFRLARF